jgi:hypothetical protein
MRASAAECSKEAPRIGPSCRLGRRRLAQRREDEGTGETGRGDERGDATDEGMGECPAVAAAQARPPGGPGADERDRQEHDPEDDGPGRQQWDLRRIADGDRVKQVRKGPDEGDRDQDAGHRDGNRPDALRLRLAVAHGGSASRRIGS